MGGKPIVLKYGVEEPPVDPNKKKRGRPKKEPLVPPIEYKCPCCGNVYRKQAGIFFRNADSPLYVHNNGYLPYCSECIRDRYNKLVTMLRGDELNAIKIMCSQFDYYFSKRVVEAALASAQGNHFSVYLAKLSLNRSREERGASLTWFNNIKGDFVGAMELPKEPQHELESVTPEQIEFWGGGYTYAEYCQMDDDYSSWIIQVTGGAEPSKSTETAIRQACMAAIDLQRARLRGDTTEIAKLSKTYMEFLTAGGLKATQADESVINDNSFGALIERWEQTQPVPDVDPMFEDVDGIKKYINTFFRGHLCKMFRLKNDTQDEYDEEIAKYTVEPVEEAEDDSDAAFYEAIRGENSDV